MPWVSPQSFSTAPSSRTIPYPVKVQKPRYRVPGLPSTYASALSASDPRRDQFSPILPRCAHAGNLFPISCQSIDPICLVGWTSRIVPFSGEPPLNASCRPPFHTRRTSTMGSLAYELNFLLAQPKLRTPWRRYGRAQMDNPRTARLVTTGNRGCERLHRHYRRFLCSTSFRFIHILQYRRYLSRSSWSYRGR